MWVKPRGVMVALGVVQRNGLGCWPLLAALGHEAFGLAQLGEADGQAPRSRWLSRSSARVTRPRPYWGY